MGFFVFFFFSTPHTQTHTDRNVCGYLPILYVCISTADHIFNIVQETALVFVLSVNMESFPLSHSVVKNSGEILRLIMSGGRMVSYGTMSLTSHRYLLLHDVIFSHSWCAHKGFGRFHRFS